MPEPKEDPEKLAEHLEQTVHAPSSPPEPAKPEPKSKPKVPKRAWITIVVLALIVAVGVGYVLATHKSKNDQVATTKPTTTPAPTTTAPKAQTYTVYVVPIAGLNLRSSKDSSSSANIITVMPFNAQAVVDDDTDPTWDHGTSGGKTGYFDKSHVTKDAAGVTAAWHKYSSTAGYSIESPAQWVIGEATFSFTFGDKSTSNASDPNAQGSTLASNGAAGGHGTPGSQTVNETTTLSGLSFKRQVWEGTNFGSTKMRLETYDAQKGDTYYHIEFTAASSNTLAWDIFSLMLTTYKITS